MDITIPIIILTISFILFASYTFFTIKYRNGENVVERPGQVYPMISVMVPIRNIDDEVEKNLESLFLLDYPGFEILFGVDSEIDPLVKIIESLRAQYPCVNSKIIVTGHSTTENPKVYKLAIMEEVAIGELIWVCDSNIRVEKSTLRKLAHEYMTNDSKIVFSPIRAIGGRSFGSIMENAYTNHFLSGSVIAAWKVFKRQIIVGKSILIEKNTLDNYFGGFSYFKDYLAEDYMMGEAYTQSKFPISTNCTWVTNYNSAATLKSFYSRMERWAKLRYRLEFHYYILEIVLNPIFMALIFSIFMIGKTGCGYAVLGGSALLKIILEYINFLFINHEDRKKLRVILLLPLAILVKDFILFLVYFEPFFGSDVKWRGGEISIGKDTLISFSQENLLLYGA